MSAARPKQRSRVSRGAAASFGAAGGKEVNRCARARGTDSGLIHQPLPDGQAEEVGIVLQPELLHDAVFVEGNGARSDI
jgi:hypothetical protein